MEMKKPEWTPIIFNNADFRRSINIRGRKVEVVVSPYDIPKEFRVAIDEEHSAVNIEFKYINQDEDTRQVNIPRDIWLQTGKMSGRLYRLGFSVNPEILVERDAGAFQMRL